VFPAMGDRLQNMKIIPTLQKASMDLVQIGEDVEKEKDRLLETFASFARLFCENMANKGFWADFIGLSKHILLSLQLFNRLYLHL
jgi:hypothetical protein